MKKDYQRLERLEQQIQTLAGKRDTGVLKVPLEVADGRMVMTDEAIQKAAAERRARTGFTGGYVVLPEVKAFP